MKAWKARYALVRPYALQSRTFTYHRLPDVGAFCLPACGGGRAKPYSFQLVLLAHMQAIPGAKACANCWPKGGPRVVKTVEGVPRELVERHS